MADKKVGPNYFGKGKSLIDKMEEAIEPSPAPPKDTGNPKEQETSPPSSKDKDSVPPKTSPVPKNRSRLELRSLMGSPPFSKAEMEQGYRKVK